MIGDFIKKLWKDWPEYEMTVRASDLNKYEDKLYEVDQRLYQLKTIDTDMSSAKEDIAELQTAEYGSVYASNSVVVTSDVKRVGTMMGYPLYQHGYNKTVGKNGSSVFENVIPAASSVERRLFDIKIIIRNRDDGKFINENSEGVSYVYDVVTNKLTVNHVISSTSNNNQLFVVVRFTEETA